MIKKIFFIALLLSAALYLGNTSSYASTTPAQPNANTANNGLAVTDATGSVYYLDLVGDIYADGREKIFRLKPGETIPIPLADDEAWNLTISRKYLYYSNWSDNHRLYRLTLDGTEKSKLTDEPVCQLTAAGDSLVYITWSNHSAQDKAIYKLPLAGGLPQKLCNDNAESLQVLGDWVYYLNASDGYTIYRIRLDGTQRSKITEDHVLFMAIADNAIYYSNYSDGQKLYSLSLDGKNKTKLTDDKAGFINYTNGYIYYTNASANHALYRVTANGQNKQLVCDLGIGPQPINIINNTLFYNHLFIKP